MNSEMSPEEEEAAADEYRERLRKLRELPPPADPGAIRARNREEDQLERRLQESEERKRKKASETLGGSA